MNFSNDRDADEMPSGPDHQSRRDPQRPLSGLVVVDLTQFLAGPYAAQIFGDLGARVIKVEPLEGDSTRTVAPHFFKGESAYFLAVNRNKESIALDLKTNAGRQVVLDLVAKADVVLENFRPGVAERLGIDYASLRRVNPAIVACSISGFGQDGPYRDRPAYDIIVQALSGGMSITGEEGGTPVRAGIPLGDIAAGMYGVIGTLAGIDRARVSGEGCHVDISMLDCQISMLSYQAAYHLMSGEVPGPQGRGHRSIPTYSAFRCGDGIEVVVAANTERMWEELCGALDLPDLPADPRFTTNAERLRNRGELDPILHAAFQRTTSEAVLARLTKARVPAAPVNTIDRALADPQVSHRGMVIDLEDRQGDVVRAVGNPIRYSGTETEHDRFPPGLGADTRTILSDFLDYPPDRLEDLVRQGVVTVPDKQEKAG